MSHERINVDPQIMCGKPCIKGTRIPIDHILMRLHDGMTPEQYINDYGYRLTLEDIKAAKDYAAENNLQFDFDGVDDDEF